MLDRSKCEKMLVSNDNMIWHKRIVVDLCNDGTCIAVLDGNEDDFHNGNSYYSGLWNHCKPIPEKQQIEKIDYDQLWDEMRHGISNGVKMIHKKQNEIIDALNKLINEDGTRK